VEATTKARATHWRNWNSYCQLVGLDPWLQRVEYRELKQHIHLYMAMVREGHYGYGRKVRATTVSAALAAINKTILLAINKDPLKIEGTNNFIPIISQTLQGCICNSKNTGVSLIYRNSAKERNSELYLIPMTPGNWRRTVTRVKHLCSAHSTHIGICVPLPNFCRQSFHYNNIHHNNSSNLHNHSSRIQHHNDMQASHLVNCVQYVAIL
jgi:hypothetical protein